MHREADLPAGHAGSGRDFQTKSLGSCLDNFTITKEGRLDLHAVRYEDSNEPGRGMPIMTAVPLGDVDTGFHGDIELYGTAEGSPVEYIARFTHGTLEWIRPLAKLPEIRKRVLMCGGFAPGLRPFYDGASPVLGTPAREA